MKGKNSVEGAKQDAISKKNMSQSATLRVSEMMEMKERER